MDRPSLSGRDTTPETAATARPSETAPEVGPVPHSEERNAARRPDERAGWMRQVLELATGEPKPQGER